MDVERIGVSFFPVVDIVIRIIVVVMIIIIIMYWCYSVLIQKYKPPETRLGLN